MCPRIVTEKGKKHTGNPKKMHTWSPTKCRHECSEHTSGRFHGDSIRIRKAATTIHPTIDGEKEGGGDNQHPFTHEDALGCPSTKTAHRQVTEEGGTGDRIKRTFSDPRRRGLRTSAEAGRPIQGTPLCRDTCAIPPTPARRAPTQQVMKKFPHTTTQQNVCLRHIHLHCWTGNARKSLQDNPCQKAKGGLPYLPKE